MKFPVQGALLDVGKGSIITLTLFVAYLKMPFFGMLPGLLAPTAGMYYFLKNGRSVGYAIVALSTAALAAYDLAAAAIYLLQCGIITVALAELISRNKGGSRSIVYALAINLVFILIVVSIYYFITGNNIHTQVVKGINSSIASTALLYKDAGLGADELKTLKQSMEQAGVFITRTYPALITVGLALIAGLNLLLLNRVAARFSQPVFLGDFRQFKNPDKLIWILIIAGFAMLLESTIASAIALNLLIVIVSAYFVQGMAVMVHTFDRFVVPLFVRFIFYLLLSLQPYLALVVAALGIFDLWGDFRTPKNNKNL